MKDYSLLYNNGVSQDMCTILPTCGALTLSYRFNKTGGFGTNLTSPVFFIEMSLPRQESERAWICVYRFCLILRLF